MSSIPSVDAVDAVGALAEPVAPAPEPEPPGRDLTPRQWVRANLVSTPANAALTVVFGLVMAYATYRLLRWLFVTTDWAIVRVNLRQFMIGPFPSDQLWRPWVSGYVLAATLGLAGGVLVGTRDRTGGDATGAAAGADPEAGSDSDSGSDGLGSSRPAPAGSAGSDHTDGPASSGWAAAGPLLQRFWPLLLAAVVVLSFTRTVAPTLLTAGLAAVFVGARLAGTRAPQALRRWVWAIVVVGVVAALQVITFGPEGVGWDDWGGVHLAVAATVAGIALAFPLGLVLALGRRSSLPAVRGLSICYIEAFRAVPLVALLFMGRYMIGFLFPTTVDPPSQLVRAVIAITLFEAAYIAEIVRGGLQAVPSGQVEAAQAIGLSPPKVLRLVVLPQALRAVIPAMVGQFISLFKDTSLLSIVSFVEILTVAERATEQDAFQGQGLQAVVLAFAGFIYWAGCSTMARESRRLERRLGVGER
jgi:general L-amino acid transport system permease protein